LDKVRKDDNVVDMMNKALPRSSPPRSYE